MNVKNFRLRSPYILFLPFLVLFLAIIVKYGDSLLQDDESRYVLFADNLLNGFYSLPGDDLNLWSGPGYPILLVPFVALKFPAIYLSLLNGAFYYLSIVFLFKSLRLYVPYKLAMALSLFWGLYYPAYIQLPDVYTECFTYFLVSASTYFLAKSFKYNNKRDLYLAGFLLGYLVLTKVIFGYVLICMILVFGLLLLLRRSDANYKKGISVLLVAILTFLPYLIYTYSLTGKALYFGNAGGVLLYWMSSPYDNELGDWKEPELTTRYRKGSSVPFKADYYLKLHHQEAHNRILKKRGVEQDDAYKEEAIANIKAHPVKYLKNWIANIGRLLFDFPNSYVYQNTNQLYKLPPNSLTVFLCVACMLPSILNWRKVSFEIKFLLFFVLLYLGATSLLSAYSRFFNIIVPVLMVWIGFIIYHTVKVNLRFNEK